MQKIKPRWLVVSGIADASDQEIRFTGAPAPKRKKGEETDEIESSHALLRSNVYFESGDISGELNLSAPQMKVQVRLGTEGRRRTTVGFNVAEHSYGLVQRDGPNVRPISLAGADTPLPTNVWVAFSIKVRGSKLEFFVEGVLVASGQVNLPRAQIEVSFSGVGTAQLRNINVQPVRPQAFVVMQFTDEYTTLFKEVIEPVCGDFGYEVVRGDNVYTNGLIIEDIARSIRESAVVLADITPNNPNVFYEVGYAHGIEKPTILLSDRSREKLPFDISGFRLLFYDNTIGGKSAVETALRRHLEAIRDA
jgi:hypothetical protein